MAATFSPRPTAIPPKGGHPFHLVHNLGREIMPSCMPYPESHVFFSLPCPALPCPALPGPWLRAGAAELWDHTGQAARRERKPE